MLKHVGRHGERKVVVAFNSLPGEDHMALVVYSDRLPMMIHDEVMKVVESAAGQSSKSLSDALYRHIMPDGNRLLGALHTGGHFKKVQTKQVILTPNAKSTVRLDELNDILAKMEQGEDAIKKMADLDAGRGFADPNKNEGREVGQPKKSVNTKATTSADMSGSTNNSGALSDADLAKINLDQAAQMEAQAKTLIAEAKRLKEEAKQFAPAKKATNVRKTATTKKAAQ